MKLIDIIESYRTDANKSLIKTNKLNLIYRFRYSLSIKPFEFSAICAQIAVEPPLLYPITQDPKSNLTAFIYKHEQLVKLGKPTINNEAYELAKSFIYRRNNWREDMVKYYRDDIESLTPVLVNEEDLISQLRENVMRSFTPKSELRSQFSKIINYWRGVQFKSSWGKNISEDVSYYSKIQEYANKEQCLFEQITKPIKST